MTVVPTSVRRVEQVSFPTITVGYELDGRPRGVPVVFLHGFPDTTATWDRVVDLLPTEDLWIIRPHIRGHGPTKIGPGHLISAETSALASDVILLADHLGIDSFHLVGSDWGCRAAYALAGLAPGRVRSMVTLGTGYNEATPVGELSLGQVTAFWYQWLFQTEHGRTLLQTQRTEFCRHLWSTWSPAWNFDDQEFAPVAAAIQNEQFVETVLHYYRYRWGGAPGTAAFRAEQALVEAMPEIVVPTTHIQGLDDHCTRPETAMRWADRVTARFRQVQLAGVGHFPQREVPDRVAADVLQTVRESER